MSSTFCLPQNCKIVQGLEPATDAAGRTGDYVCLKNVHRAWLVFHITQGNAATVACSVSRATAVLPAGATAMTENCEIWSNLDCAASDTLVKRAAAANYTTDAGVKHKIVILQVDPESLAATFDCIAPVTGASNIANLTSCVIYLQERYQQATPPTAITD